jgi:pSer/pThr/pTyr-binding forkhead associated (FHA) protein
MEWHAPVFRKRWLVPYRLVFLIHGPQWGQSFEISIPELIVGRHPWCQLRSTSRVVSRRHCTLLAREDRLFVRDLRSTNGTLVNGQRVRGEQELHDGDCLLIGPHAFGIRISA